MSPRTRGQPRINLPDVQHDSIAEVSQKLSNVTARLRDSEIDSNLDEVKYLVSEVERKIDMLNRIVNDLIKAIRRKQETRRRPEQPDKDVSRKKRKPDTGVRPDGGASARDKQQQIRPPEQQSLRIWSQNNESSLFKLADRKDSMRSTRFDSLGGSCNAIKTADLVRKASQDGNPDAQVSSSEEDASSVTRGQVGKLEKTSQNNEGEDLGCGSAHFNDGGANHDAFSRELVSMFNQSIGESPGGPSGFLGAIDVPEAPGCDAEGDVGMLDGDEVRDKKRTDDEALIIVESDSDREEAFIEISKEGLPQDPDQMTKGATVAYGFSDDTLDRLLPGVQLNDTTILDLLNTMLPAAAEPLIARWAITNFPTSGLAGNIIASSEPPPMLRHKMTSTCLFLVYNVIFGTLSCDSQGNGNHWILIVVDISGFRVHVFGTENGLEFEAYVLASNVGTFVNNYRFDQDEDVIQWSEPQYHPLYPHGIVPDDYNCGICVAHRAETFIYPEKALNISENTAPTTLSEQLDRLRNQDPASRPIKISRFSLQILPTLPDIEPKLVASKQWKTCLFRCAESNGFSGKHIVEAFEEAPASDLYGVLRALQCMCEVANANLLLRLKKVLASENQALLRESWPSEPRTLVEIVELHHAIGWFNEVDPYLSIFKASCCQINYHMSFQRRVDSLSGNLREERKRRKRLRRKTTGNSRGETLQRSQDNSSARQRVMAEVIDLLDPENVDRSNVEDAVKRYEKAGKILKLLKGCRNSFWLLLYPLYDNQPASFDFVRQPILNIMDFEPPETFNRLRKPISRADLVDMTGPIAKYFGSSLFIARPELEDITLNRENGQFDCRVLISFKSDEEILKTKPRDVPKLFMGLETST